MNKIHIAGLELKWFIIIAIMILSGCFLGSFPSGMVGAFLFLMVFGELFNVIGNKTPFVNTFFGGGAIICIFGGAAIVYWHLLPDAISVNCSSFMKSAGFFDFYIAALITGSILGMDIFSSYYY